MSRPGKPTPEDVVEIVAAACGSALHFAMLPANEAAFTEFLNARRDEDEAIPAALVRKMASMVHDLVAPDCDEPIEVV